MKFPDLQLTKVHSAYDQVLLCGVEQNITDASGFSQKTEQKTEEFEHRKKSSRKQEESGERVNAEQTRSKGGSTGNSNLLRIECMAQCTQLDLTSMRQWYES